MTRNGCSREERANRRPAGLPTNGSESAADRDRFCSEKMPTPTVGIPRLNPAWMPSGVDGDRGRVAEPVGGSSRRMVSTKARAPTNSSPTPSAATSGLRPGSETNFSVPIETRTTPASVREKPRSSPATVVSGGDPSSRVTVRTSSRNCALPSSKSGLTGGVASNSGFQTSRVTVALGDPSGTRHRTGADDRHADCGRRVGQSGVQVRVRSAGWAGGHRWRHGGEQVGEVDRAEQLHACQQRLQRRAVDAAGHLARHRALGRRQRVELDRRRGDAAAGGGAERERHLGVRREQARRVGAPGRTRGPGRCSTAAPPRSAATPVSCSTDCRWTPAVTACGSQPGDVVARHGGPCW